MKITRTVHVTQEDIDDGVILDTDSCMLALAFRREFSDLGWIDPVIGVNPEESSMMVNAHGEWYELFVDSACDLWQQNVELFDMAEPVKPFDCEVVLISGDELPPDW